MPSILAIDVGNSHVKVGLFERATEIATSRLLSAPSRALSIPLSESLPWNDLAKWVTDREVSAVIAGPNPPAIRELIDAWRLTTLPAPRQISSPEELGLDVRVDFPERVGIDRLLNVVATNALRPAGRRAVVISAGTATTVDLIAEDGAFEGGAILPGLELAARSLQEHTALLPLVPMAELSADDIPPLGKNTTAAIRSGLLYGHIGAVRELIQRLAGGTEPFLVVTGGLGALLAPHLSLKVTFESDLALRGLARIAGA